MAFRITSLWAWTSIGEDDEEGIIGYQSDGMWMPLIASDRVRVDEFRRIAQIAAETTGRPVVLRRFSTSEELERIEP